TGWRRARADYVAFMDDDARAPADWLREVCEGVRADAPEVFGGKVLPFYPSGRPAWVSDAVADSMRDRHDLGDRPLRLTQSPFVWGSNIVIRKGVLERLGGFRPRFGVRAYGDETDLQLRLLRREPGARIRYYPRIVIHHVVPARKLSLAWQFCRAWRHGMQAGSIYGREAFAVSRFPKLEAMGRAFAHVALAVLRALALPCRSRRQFRSWRAYLMARVFPHVYSVPAYLSFAFGWFRTGPRAR
ncbi:MAG: glycosyltransferase family 2 protein, partial [Planctomycetota bacterium]